MQNCNLKPFKFAYLSVEDPENKKVWSGTHYSILRALKNIGTVDILGPYEPKTKLLLLKILNQVSLKLFNKRISYRHGTLLSKEYADYFTKKLAKKSYDYIIAPAASAETAFLETAIPVIYITDGTFKSCLNYHKSLSNLTEKSIETGNSIEQKAIEKSKLIIVSSEWAAKSVIEDYKASPNKVKIIPYGANFENIPSEQDLVFEAPTEWKLLFVGVYWESKGGDIAYKAFKILKEKKYNVTLTVVGCIPPTEILEEGLTVIPFINKNNAEGQTKLAQVFKEHHLLILPTRFDCTPIVINEASAFGVPCLVADTGGVRGHLTEDVNGYLIDYNDKGINYAKKIEELINYPAKYIALRQSTRKEYTDKLNWNHWLLELQKLI